jgi:hypothetical protein
MRILRVKNYEKYQNHRSKDPRWIKLYRTLLTDRDFLKLDIDSRYIFVGLLILASETANTIVNDPSYLAHRLSIDASRLNLTPLFRSGLLVASSSTLRRMNGPQRREETERETETEKRQIVCADQVAKQPSRQLTDDEWLVSHVRANPAYAHINIDQELGKMDAWLSTRPQKKKTRRFIINWLNRAEKPVNGLQADPLKAMVQQFIGKGGIGA